MGVPKILSECGAVATKKKNSRLAFSLCGLGHREIGRHLFNAVLVLPVACGVFLCSVPLRKYVG